MQDKPDTSTVIGKGPSDEILTVQLCCEAYHCVNKIWTLLAVAD